MDAMMEIDNNPRKRCRDELPECHHVAKRARQSDADASARDDSTPSTPNESTVSTPASTDSMDMEMEMDDAFQALQPKPQPQAQSTIISGWNRSRRNHYLNQGYPLHWMQTSTQVIDGSLFVAERGLAC
jgi:predicted component of type VI protein secretion system